MNTTMKILIVFLVAFLFSCLEREGEIEITVADSGERVSAHTFLEGGGSPEALDPNGPELGTLAQPLFSATLGYGQLNSTGMRCGSATSTWPGTACSVLKTKTLKVRFLCDGCTAAQNEGFLLGRAVFLDGLSIESGMSVQAVQMNENILIRVAAVPPTADGDPLGDASLVSNTINDITPSTDRKYKRFHYCDARLDYAQIAGIAGLTTAQRKNAYANALLHEGGHCVGFGHANCTGSQAMCKFGHNVNTPGYQFFEYDYLEAYSPL